MDKPITPNDVRLSLATKQAIQAADGLEPCSQDTGKSTSQLSRCSSRDHRDSLTIVDAVIIDRANPGDPIILNAMARLLNCAVFRLPEPGAASDEMQMSMVGLARELGDVAATFSTAIGDGAVSVAEFEAVSREVQQLIQQALRFEELVKAAAGLSKGQ